MFKTIMMLPSSRKYQAIYVIVAASTNVFVDAFHFFNVHTTMPTKNIPPTSNSVAPSFVPFGGTRSTDGQFWTADTDLNSVRNRNGRYQSDDQNPEEKRTLTTSTNTGTRSTTTTTSTASQIEMIRQEWIDNSVQYYSKVMREERRRSNGQLKDDDVSADPLHHRLLAKKHYFALRKIKDGKPEQAELIYRRIINELLQEQRHEADDGDNHHCDHSKLAVTTLLLALHLQRNNSCSKKTRSVFLNFFRIVTSENDENEECACSAKVLQAFALFEMKQGNSLKSLELVMAAIKLDPTLTPVLNWKQFRDAMQRRKKRQNNFHQQTNVL